jgi:hypothetical protein
MLSEQAQTNELYTAKPYVCIDPGVHYAVMVYLYVWMYVHACTQVWFWPQCTLDFWLFPYFIFVVKSLALMSIFLAL